MQMVGALAKNYTIFGAIPGYVGINGVRGIAPEPVYCLSSGVACHMVIVRQMLS